MRYLIARYDAFNCVWFWTPLNEYEYYPDGDWRYSPVADRWALRIARWIKRTAPHGHIVSVHNGPTTPPFAERFGQDPTAIDAVMLQTWGTTGADDGWLAAGIEETAARALPDGPGRRCWPSGAMSVTRGSSCACPAIAIATWTTPVAAPGVAPLAGWASSTGLRTRGDPGGCWIAINPAWRNCCTYAAFSPRLHPLLVWLPHQNWSPRRSFRRAIGPWPWPAPNATYSATICQWAGPSRHLRSLVHGGRPVGSIHERALCRPPAPPAQERSSRPRAANSTGRGTGSYCWNAEPGTSQAQKTALDGLHRARFFSLCSCTVLTAIGLRAWLWR